MRYLQIWSEYWTEIANGRQLADMNHLHGFGLRWMGRALLCFGSGMVLFALSCFVVAFAIGFH